MEPLAKGRDVQVSPPKTNRLLLTGSIYHQILGHGPTAIALTLATQVHSEEEVYKRNIVVRQDWQELNLGWFSDGAAIGILAIANQAGKDLLVQPTVEQRARIASQVLLLGKKTEFSDRPIVFGKISPGSCLPFCLEDYQSLWVRSLGEDATKITLFLFPG